VVAGKVALGAGFTRGDVERVLQRLDAVGLRHPLGAGVLPRLEGLDGTQRGATVRLLPPFFQGRRAASAELLDDPATWRTHRLDTRLHALSYLCPLLSVILKPEDQQLTPALTSSDPALTLDAGKPNTSEGIRGIHGSMADGIRAATSRLSNVIRLRAAAEAWGGPVVSRMKYFCAWLATCVSVRLVT
jgi:hypothetical protein